MAGRLASRCFCLLVGHHDGILLTADGRRTLDGSGLSYGRAKECFANAARHVLLFGDDRYRYTEGVVCYDGLAIQHAWLTDETGKVFDITLRGEDDLTCGFCDGAGAFAEEDAEGYEIEVDCAQCNGTGETDTNTSRGDYAYFGVTFDTEVVRDHVMSTGVFCPLLDDEAHRKAVESR